MRVVWSPRALRDLRDQRDYIAQHQPDAAARIARRIIDATDRLELYPRYGRAAGWDPAARLRELPVASTPFLVLYVIDEDAQEVLIVKVVHGAQRRETEGLT